MPEVVPEVVPNPDAGQLQGKMQYLLCIAILYMNHLLWCYNQYYICQQLVRLHCQLCYDSAGDYLPYH